MKITGFRPLIITNDAEAVIDMFEDLGFALRHTKTGIGENSDTNYVMKDSGGNRVYITGSESTRSDLTGISINVDDFEETYDFLMARGFRDPRGGQVTETPSSRTTMLYSPSGFPLFITEHITDSPYKTGIIGAMKEEVDTLKAALTKLKTSTIAGMEFNEGKLNGKSVVVVQCGMGKVNAGICANTLVHTFGVDRIINTGVAGSLNADIDIGDLVISTDAVQHDFTVEAIGFGPWPAGPQRPRHLTARCSKGGSAPETSLSLRVSKRSRSWRLSEVCAARWRAEPSLMPVI